ncbi:MULTISPECIES: GNAT family N-acetyltransferase [Roseivirga]|uniref:GNAT family N-acetyltransferase n=1 Tax=Roseivirga TaxID=290180 RepID=UPI001B120A4C|nr:MULTISPECIES: GNAT family N-acetyltransferase [Roseivirga]MBO6660676.1 GNAT family N-acetyltransferase [Roseivirga sp.]MBO6910341.1 GNAT family N-acetyltransferase [Roseivirga sp.]WPZ12249.1 GNAT family N-acetyltransferase [Roseivirga spongicola]
MEILEGSFSEALEVLRGLPEFDPLLSTDHYVERMANKPKLIAIAWVEEKPVGCKIAYDRFEDGTLYSWLGGVIPKYRKMGLAKKLADFQEKWALENGFSAIRFKTLNRHKAMLTFAINNGFQIYSVKPKDEIENYRIELIKDLK